MSRNDLIVIVAVVHSRSIFGCAFSCLMAIRATCSLVPRPTPFFLFFSLLKRAKNREGQGTLVTWMTSGGREVDVGEVVPNYKFVCNKP